MKQKLEVLELQPQFIFHTDRINAEATKLREKGLRHTQEFIDACTHADSLLITAIKNPTSENIEAFHNAEALFLNYLDNPNMKYVEKIKPENA